MIKSYIRAFGLSLMICSRAMTQLLDFPKSSLYVMVLGFLLVLVTSIKQVFNSKKMRLISFVAFAFIVSLLVSGMNDTTLEYFLYFICFGATSLLVPKISNLRGVMRIITMIGVILIWSYITIDYEAILRNQGGLIENVAAVLMDISYKTLVFVITGFLLAVSDDKWLVRILSGITALLYLLIAFTYGARGALLSVVVFVLLFWIIRSNTKAIMNKRIVISIAGVLIAFLLFAPIVEVTFHFLESHNIEARAIERVYDKVSDNESMSASRGILYKKALSGFVDSPIWGHGIGSFDNYSGVYPHNIILQLMYEGGIILTVPLLVLLIKGFMMIFSFGYQLSYRKFLLLLFCSGIVELFLSSHLWMSICLWLFYGQVLLSRKYVEKQI